MGLSIFLARVLGIYFAVMTIALLANREYYRQSIADLFAHNGVMLLTSIVTLILGLLLVLSHNIWVYDWPVIITILAWLTLTKGVLRLLLPNRLPNWSKLLYNDVFFYITQSIMALLALALIHYGFFYIPLAGIIDFSAS